MTRKNSLLVILLVGLAGVIFSGVLTYRDFLAQTATCSPVGQAGTLFGYPPCVYGLVMYAVLVVSAILGLTSKY
ncbi:MAG TPA: hypothetical protein VF117_00745 [Gammaproteobacteria bacterium]